MKALNLPAHLRGYSKTPTVSLRRFRVASVRAGERYFALIMRLVPHVYRFDAVVALARFAVPVMRKTAAYHEQQIKNFHEPKEIALHLLLNALTKNSTTFDPPFAVNGYQYFESATATGQGVLVIGHHAALTLFMIRVFHNNGRSAIVITPDTGLRIPGTLATARSIQPSSTALLKVRTRFRHGDVVCAMPDRAEHDSPRTFEFSTPAGPVIMNPALFELAARCGAKVLFTEVRLKGKRLVATIVSPSGEPSDANLMISEFISFVRSRVSDSREVSERLTQPQSTLKQFSPGRSPSGG